MPTSATTAPMTWEASVYCFRDPSPLPMPVPLWALEENAPRSARPFPVGVYGCACASTPWRGPCPHTKHCISNRTDRQTGTDRHAVGSMRSRAPNVPPHPNQQALPPKMHYTSHLTWTGNRDPSPFHGSRFRRKAPQHAVPLVVVVDGGSKQQGKQQCMLLCVEGGRMSVLGRFPSYSEPHPLRHQSETLSFRTLNRRIVAARVPTSGAKGQDLRGEGRQEAGRAR